MSTGSVLSTEAVACRAKVGRVMAELFEVVRSRCGGRRGGLCLFQSAPCRSGFGLARIELRERHAQLLEGLVLVGPGVIAVFCGGGSASLCRVCRNRAARRLVREALKALELLGCVRLGGERLLVSGACPITLHDLFSVLGADPLDFTPLSLGVSSGCPGLIAGDARLPDPLS